ncbi:MAG TPA: hypothetical protein VGK31_03835, partial [Thermoanaerobaculia bacterium]
RITQHGAIVRLGGNLQKPPAGEMYPFRVIANDGVFQHFAGERQLAIRGVDGKGKNEQNEYENVSHTRNVAPPRVRGLRTS